MNKKTVFTFLLGFMASAALFGVVCLAYRSSSHTAPSSLPSVAGSRVPVPAAPRRLMTVQDSPALQSLVAPTFGISGESAKETGNSSAKISSPNIATTTETAAFKSFISPEPDAHSIIHEVKSGNTLIGIARKYHVNEDLVRRINRMKNDNLAVGQKLKIPTYQLSAVVDKSQNTLILKGDEEVLKTYVVSTGKENSTPVGVFKITNKLVNPTWYKGDGKVIPYGSSENQLGSRWMGLTKKGYGIHGTVEPEKLGQQVTAGCVRMKNEDVEELYGFLTPGMEVTIVD